MRFRGLGRKECFCLDPQRGSEAVCPSLSPFCLRREGVEGRAVTFDTRHLLPNQGPLSGVHVQINTVLTPPLPLPPLAYDP